MNLILGLPSELASALAGGGNTGVNVLDISAEKTLDKTMQIFDPVGVTPSSWLNALVGIVFLCQVCSWLVQRQCISLYQRL